FFFLIGTKGASKKEQLVKFTQEFNLIFPNAPITKTLDNWGEAFCHLCAACKRMDNKQKIILFFDELPWLASPRSNFLSEMEYAWNQHFAWMEHILLIVCGSVASWIIHKVIYGRGGLYGRVTEEIKLLPFTLSEMEMFLVDHHIALPRRAIVELFMVTGGVAKYLTYIDRGKSPAQIINNTCFRLQGPLYSEFHKIYTSHFDQSERHIKVIRALAKKRRGMKADEIIESLDMRRGGTATRIIRDLEESGFISPLPDFGKEVKEKRYRLTDEYSYFYLQWIEPMRSQITHRSDQDYWNKMINTPAYYTWSGYTFENICIKHAYEIKRALGLGAVSTTESYFADQGIEIDLVIDRADNCINICEIKFSNGEFVIDKAYAEQLEKKKHIFQKQTKKAVFLVMITPYGVKENHHYIQTVDSQLTLDALFMPK
ncbi:MAG: ATP-binding protein, partial [Chlamydiia bacterium]|nr:ATP-binding protein [Chlamydiia bacterium]